MRKISLFDSLREYLSNYNTREFSNFCLYKNNKIFCWTYKHPFKLYQMGVFYIDTKKYKSKYFKLSNDVKILYNDMCEDIFTIHGSFTSCLKLHIKKLNSELEEEDIIDIPLPLELEDFDNSLFCKTKYSIHAKLLDKRYIFVKLMLYFDKNNKLEMFEPLFIFIDIIAKKYYLLSSRLSKKIKHINVVQVHLFDSKYLFFEINNLGSSEKHDLLVNNKEGSDIVSTDHFTQKHIIYPIEQLKVDILKDTVDFEKYTFTCTQFDAVLPFYFIENDNYYYLKTYVNENKSEFYKINLLEKNNSSHLICTIREKILENSSYTNYKIIKVKKIDKKDVLYIAREIVENQEISIIEALYLGKKIVTKNYNTFKFNKKERCIDICESDGYLVTMEYLEPNNTIFKFFSLYDKRLLLQTEPCSNILYFNNPLDNEEILVVPY
ncbi:hypothetical protein [Caldicellulosiruptor morganii]|uniref:Uncharacterized protein n=1 Tax=Caldicellulosiruptor morganii TaxID=1387555 RepID=A0ABY7BNQ2_9FIRM|nr:hypothetical protein [Caldicellulosiruptor morganii]WAM33390.1 hypothetical protein OTK00_001887 [Caldicellulosiruptor morganii]